MHSIDKPSFLRRVFALLFALASFACAACSTLPKETDASTAPKPADTASASETLPRFDLASRTVKLNSGHSMPLIGLGTWTMTDEQAEECVYHALKIGVRLIDTARYYQCEVGVGRGVKRAIAEGFVTREEVFITTKIQPSDMARPSEAIDDSLAALDCDHIDLMLIHEPGSNDEQVYRAMEAAVRAGKLRSIGISNYNTIEALDEVLSYAEIPPAVIQIENHIYNQNRELKQFAEKHGIVINSYYPFGGRGNTQELFNNELILELAEKYGRSSAQIILRWHLQAGYVAVPGSKNPDHISENYSVFDFELTYDEMQRILRLDEQRRFANW